MRERQAVSAQTAPKYRKAGKKKKGEKLDQFVELTGCNRKYAIFCCRTGVSGAWCGSMESW
jgi:hypothetical protein